MPIEVEFVTFGKQEVRAEDQIERTIEEGQTRERTGDIAAMELVHVIVVQEALRRCPAIIRRSRKRAKARRAESEQRRLGAHRRHRPAVISLHLPREGFGRTAVQRVNAYGIDAPRARLGHKRRRTSCDVEHVTAAQRGDIEGEEVSILGQGTTEE